MGGKKGATTVVSVYTPVIQLSPPILNMFRYYRNPTSDNLHPM